MHFVLTFFIFKRYWGRLARYENIYDKIQELLGVIPGSVSILEQQIDSDLQMEYYNHAEKLKKKFDTEYVLKNRDSVFEEDQSVEDKKDMMVKLASIDSIEAYRTLEKCTGTMSDHLKDWAILALQENRLLLESKLLDQNRILISTGLGGKGLKLRYFAVLVSSSGQSFSDFDRKIILNEIRFAIKKSGGELEDIQFDEELCTVLSIIPLQVAVQKLYDDIIQECNHFGDFIKKDYIITNVKVIPNGEIRQLTGKHKKQNPED